MADSECYSRALSDETRSGPRMQPFYRFFTRLAEFHPCKALVRLAPRLVPSRKKKLGRRGGGREILCPMWRTYVHQASWGAGARSARAPRSAERSAAQYGIAAARSGGAPHRRSPPYAVTARKARRASQVEPVNCLSSNRSSSRASARPAPSPSALLVIDRVSLLLCDENVGPDLRCGAHELPADT